MKYRKQKKKNQKKNTSDTKEETTKQEETDATNNEIVKEENKEELPKEEIPIIPEESPKEETPIVPEEPKEEKDDKNDEELEETKPTLSDEQLKAKNIVDNIITASMSDFDKALAIHDWLTFNIDYDNSYSVRTVSDTLAKKVAVCEGYAKTFKMMAELAGLEAEIVTGNANGPHAWNQVKINGTWYNVDVTWDDPTYSGKKASDHSNNNYNYFLISDSTLKKDHTPDSVPHNCSSDYNRKTVLKSGINNGYRKNHGYAETQAEANTVIKKMIEKGYSEFYIWHYNSTVNSTNYSEKIYELTKTSIYPVTALSATEPKNNVTIYKLKPTISLNDWKNIKIVTNKEDFASYLNAQIEQNNKEFYIRYESDGTFDMGNVLYSFNYSYIDYGQSYRLFTITPIS